MIATAIVVASIVAALWIGELVRVVRISRQIRYQRSIEPVIEQIPPRFKRAHDGSRLVAIGTASARVDDTNEIVDALVADALIVASNRVSSGIRV